MYSLLRRSLENLHKAIIAIALSIAGYILVIRLGYSIIARLILLLGIGIALWLSPGLLVILVAVSVGYFALMLRAPIPPGISNITQSIVLAQEEQPSIPVKVWIGTTHDVFQDRIRNPQEVENVINDVQSVYSGYSEGADFQGFPEFVRALFEEIVDNLSDPKKLAPIITEVFVVAPTASLGFIIGRYMVEKIRSWSSNQPDNQYSSQLVEKLEQLLSYFQSVQRSRMTEIAQGTGLSREEARALLRLGPFTHEASCFWRLAD